MNIHTPLIRTIISAALFAGLVSFGYATAEPVTMRVQARAPVHATLLPTVHVSPTTHESDAALLARVGTAEALSVTLMPTVYVTARRSELLLAMERDATRAAPRADGA